jgi:hypothetical protein
MAEFAKIIQPEETPDVAKEKLVILPEVPQKIANILKEAEKLEKKQLKIKNPTERRNLCNDALIEYQKALDLVRAEAKKYARWGLHDKQDIFIAQEIYITNRMDYLEGVKHGLSASPEYKT